MNASTPPQNDTPVGLSQTADRLLHVLEYVAQACDLEFDHGGAGIALRKGCHTGEPRPLDDWIDLLTQVGASVGLNVYGVRQTTGDVRAMATPNAPWLTVALRGEFAGEWIAVQKHRGQTVLVKALEADTERWMDVAKLTHMVAAASDTTEVTWLIAEPAFPLESLRDPGDHSPARRLLALLKVEAGDVWIVTAYALAIGLLSLVVPLTVQSLVNTVAFGTLLQPLVVLTLVVLIALAAAAALRVIQVGVVEMLQRRLFVRTAVDLAYRLPRVRQDGFGHHHGPELVNRFFDVITLQKGTATLLLDGLGILLTTLIGMVLLAFYHPLLLAFDLVLIGGIWLVLGALGRDAVGTAIKESQAKYAVAGWLEELARHPLAFRSLGGPHHALEHADTLVRHYLKARDRHYQVYRRQLLGSLGLQVVASAVLLGLGGWLVMQRQLTLGQLVAAELVVTKVVEGFAKLSKYLDTYYDLTAAADKLGHLVDLPLDRGGGMTLPDGDRPATVTLRQVAFSPSGLTGPIELRLEAGSHTAITGSHDSGKRALVDLLGGFRFPTAGVVEINGRDTRDLDLGDLRRAVAVVRDAEVFAGSVADNVSMGRPEVSAAAVREALDAAGLLDVVLHLPDGVQTRLMTGGAPLTRNQTLRLMVARALAAKPTLLILDKVLDGMDRPSRDHLLARLFETDTPWTLAVITQRDDVMARCPVVYELHADGLRPVSPSSETAHGQEAPQ